MRKHSERCENAKPKSRCRCRCGGSKHGTHSAQYGIGFGPNVDRSVNINMGGDLGKAIESMTGKSFECSCRRTIPLGSNFLAYPHEGGLADAEGNKWWLYVSCPWCDYDWSWWKIENRLQQEKK